MPMSTRNDEKEPMRALPAAVIPSTATPVAVVAAPSAQTRLPGADRQPQNRRRNSGERFLTHRDGAAQPGLRVIPTEIAAVVQRALPTQAASTDAAAPIRAGRWVAPETILPHQTPRRDIRKDATDAGSSKAGANPDQVPAWQARRDNPSTTLSRFSISGTTNIPSHTKEDNNEDQN